AGNFSARYSMIASDSQTRTSPSINTGTLPAPLIAVTRALKSFASSEMTVSSKAMPAPFMASHGRNDQDDKLLLPIIRCRLIWRPSAARSPASVTRIFLLRNPGYKSVKERPSHHHGIVLDRRLDCARLVPRRLARLFLCHRDDAARPDRAERPHAPLS